MAPTLLDGDYLLLYRSERFRPGQVVLMEDNQFRLVLKRLSHLTDAGWWVLGDNPDQSTDSRQYGAVTTEQLKAIALARYWPWPKLIRSHA